MNVRRMIFLCFIVSPLAQGANDTEIRNLGREWLEANDGIGLSIGIYANSRRQYYNFGATRLDGNAVPTENTVYEIGGLSKTMTGQLLARAIIESRATFNDEAAKYLDGAYPNLENGGEVVRLLHLANMTSQLADNIPDLSQVRLVPGETLITTQTRVLEKYSRAEFLRQLHMVKPQRPPGSDPAQSDVGSMLLGVVLEKLYGEPFEAILARQIEKPLKMNSGTAPPIKTRAQGYTRDNEPTPPFAARTHFAAGSLRYSADDLLRYASWQAAERDASVKLAHKPTWLTQDQRQGVALYWIIEDSPYGRRLHFSGATFGFASLCDLYPEAGIAIVLLSNKAADGAQKTLRALSAKLVELTAPGGAVRPQPSSTGAPQQDR